MKRTYYVFTDTTSKLFSAGAGMMLLSVAAVVANVVLFVHFGLDFKLLFPIGVASLVVGGTIMLTALWKMPREEIEVDAKNADSELIADDISSATTASIAATSSIGSSGVSMF